MNSIAGYELLQPRSPEIKTLPTLAIPALIPGLPAVVEKALAQDASQHPLAQQTLKTPASETLVTLAEDLTVVRELEGQAAAQDQAARPLRLLLTGLRIDAATTTPQLATSLRDAVEGSGLFFESHLAQWVAGSRPLSDIRSEAAQRWSTAPGEPPRLPVPAQGTHANAPPTYDLALGMQLAAARAFAAPLPGAAPESVAPAPPAARAETATPAATGAFPDTSASSTETKNQPLAAYVEVASAIVKPHETSTAVPVAITQSGTAELSGNAARAEANSAVASSPPAANPAALRDDILNQQMHYLRSGEMALQLPASDNRHALLLLGDENGATASPVDTPARATLELDLPALGKVTILLQVAGDALGVQIAPEHEGRIGREDLAALALRLGQISGLRLEYASLRNAAN